MNQIGPIPIPAHRIADFCKRHGIARLSLFGSILRDDFRPDSDVDMLVEFLPGMTPTLFAIARMEDDLTQMLGREVDLRTPADLSRYFREKVVAGARVLHAA